MVFIIEHTSTVMERAVFAALLLVSASLSGCLKLDNGSSEVEEPSGDDVQFFEDGIYTCIEHEDIPRCWQTHIPEGLDPDEPVPLIVDIHGYGGTSTLQRSVTQFDEIADEYGAIVVYPDGSESMYPWDPDQSSEQAWNAGWCCGSPAQNDVDDIGFLLRMIDLVSENHQIDQNRIYVTGWSNGCAMSQYLAMKASEVFAAVGCMSFYLITEYDSEYSPIPIMEVHGFLDQVVLYESSVLNVPTNPDAWVDPEALETGAIENMYEWADYNECSGSVENFEINALYSIQGFDDCQYGADVRLMTIYGAQHNPYAKDVDDGTVIGSLLVGTQGLVQSSHIVWEFMSKYSKENEGSIPDY